MSNNTQVRNLLSELVPTPTGKKDENGNPILVENKSVKIPTASAVSLYDLIAPHANTERVVIQLDGQIRLRTDGGNPTASFGALFGKFDCPDFPVEMLKHIRAISVAGVEVNAFVIQLTY